MKTSHMLVAVVLALTASLTHAGGTLGSSAVAATAPSRIDSSAGSQMGPAAPANVDPNAPTKPGSIPGTAAPQTNESDGGLAGGFAADKKNTTEDGSDSTEDTMAKPEPTTVAPTTAPATTTPAPVPTKSAAVSSFGAASVVTIVSVTATAATLAW